MNDRRLLLTWLLLLLVTLLFGGVAAKLMVREQERIDLGNEAAVRQRLELVADEVRLAVSGIQEDLMNDLEAMPGNANLVVPLRELERNHPLVMATFVWNKNRGVMYPSLSKASSADVTDFLERYQPLFSGEESWEDPRSDNEPTATAAQAPPSPAQQNASRRMQQAPQQSEGTITGNYNTRSTFGAVKSTSRFSPKDALKKQAIARETKWIPWHWQNEFSLLGAVIDKRYDQVHGLELDSIALLARLEPFIAGATPQRGLLGLRDSAGTWIHWTGDDPVDETITPEYVLPIGGSLPTYEVFGHNLSWTGGAEKRVFLLSSGLQILTLMLAILGLGSLLLWQARRNMRDARMKTGFVSNVSHELKTPLTTIQMYAELLSENRVTDPDKRRRYLDVIVGESQRLGRLVNNVLDFGRLEQGRRAYDLTDLDLVPFVRERVRQRGECRKTGSRLCVVSDLDACPVRADADALGQVLSNLIDNALKYGGDGPVDIELATDPTHAILRVLDCGPGVPAAHQRKIFEKFHRVDNSLTRDQSGSGLGLSIARRLVDGMGGSLSYCDRKNPGGACFEIRIPHIYTESQNAFL